MGAAPPDLRDTDFGDATPCLSRLVAIGLGEVASRGADVAADVVTLVTGLCHGPLCRDPAYFRSFQAPEHDEYRASRPLDLPMKVLYLAEPNNGLDWYRGVCQACSAEHAIGLFDPQKPLEAQFEGVEVVVDQGGSVGTHAMMDAGRRQGVRLWQVLGTGLDHVDVDYMLQCGFLVANCPGVFSAIALAEHALFLMLYLAKRFPESQKLFDARQRCAITVNELHGKTLGLVGFGASGRELASRAAALGMQVLAIDVTPPSANDAAAWKVEFLGGSNQLEGLMRRADFVSLHVPLIPSTRHMINRQALSWMQPHAMLVNVARGGLVDTDALVEALRNRRIGGAGLDVFEEEPVDPDHPLLKFDNVVATPHIAGGTHGTARRRGEAAAENIARLARGQAPLHQITK